MCVMFPADSQPPGLRGCAITRVSSSASQTAAVSRRAGSATATRTARTAAMNTTPARLAPAPPRSSAATTGTACCAAGSATGTTTVETPVMNVSVRRRLSDVQAGSGSAPATVCASTSPKCATTLQTAPTVLTSLRSAVSLSSAFVTSTSPQNVPNISERKGINSQILTVCLWILVFKSLHVCDLTCINLKMICDSPFLPFSQLSDEPLPGRNKPSIIARNCCK